MIDAHTTKSYTLAAFPCLVMMIVAVASFNLASPLAQASEVTGILSAGTESASSVTGVLAANVTPSSDTSSSLSGTVTGGVNQTSGSFSGGSFYGGGSPLSAGSSLGGSVSGGSGGSSGGGSGTPDYLPNASYAYNSGIGSNEPGYPNTGGYGGYASDENASPSVATTSTSTIVAPNPTALTAATADAGLSGTEEEVFLIIGALIILGLATYGISKWIISRREA